METVVIARRITHKFVGIFRYLDQWETIGRVRITNGRDVRKYSDIDGPEVGPRYIRFARLPNGVKRSVVLRAIEDELSAWGCSHEWDCCGCASYSTRVYPYKGRVVRIVTDVTYNY